jgi:predicted amidophosphoribosyltransferase
MIQLKEIRESLLQIVFPHICSGCGSDLLNIGSNLCLRCVNALHETDFEKHENNPVEKMFWGRLPLKSASASYYFTKESLVQHLMHQFKYKNNKELGLQLGRMTGYQLLNSGRFKVDAIVPLPLFPGKEKRRGYNQCLN